MQFRTTMLALLLAFLAACASKPKQEVPAPEIVRNDPANKKAILFFGTSSYSAIETLDLLQEDGIRMNAVRIKSFPFHQDLMDFIELTTAAAMPLFSCAETAT